MSRIEKKYYIRRSTKAEPAEEYEVRWMFESGMKDMETLSKFLQTRNLVQATDLSNAHLITSLVHEVADDQSKRGRHPPQEPHAIFAVCPKWLEERIKVTSQEFEKWLISKRDLYKRLVGRENRPSLDSLLTRSWRDEDKNYLDFYTEIFRNGYIETGKSQELFVVDPDIKVSLHLSRLVGNFFYFLRFMNELYAHISYQDDIDIIMCLKNVSNIMLYGYGRKNAKEVWPEPSYCDKKPICLHKDIRMEKAVLASELTESKINELGYDFAEKISNAFGEKFVKCFDDNRNFSYGGFFDS